MIVRKTIQKAKQMQEGKSPLAFALYLDLQIGGVHDEEQEICSLFSDNYYPNDFRYACVC